MSNSLVLRSKEGLVDVVGFHVIVDGFEGMQVQFSEKVVQAVPETP